MKAKLKKGEGTFKPIEITLTIEPKDELKYLWNIFQPKEKKLFEIIKKNFEYIECATDSVDTYPVFDMLDNIVEEVK